MSLNHTSFDHVSKFYNLSIPNYPFSYFLFVLLQSESLSNSYPYLIKNEGCNQDKGRSWSKQYQAKISCPLLNLPKFGILFYHILSRPISQERHDFPYNSWKKLVLNRLSFITMLRETIFVLLWISGWENNVQRFTTHINI